MWNLYKEYKNRWVSEIFTVLAPYKIKIPFKK